MIEGRDIDMLVAERIFGWVDDAEITGSTSRIGVWRKPDGTWTNIHELPRYTTSMADAWLVVEAMKEQRFSVRRAFIAKLNAVVQSSTRRDSSTGWSVAWPDAIFWLKPEHIALAALDALAAPVPES